MPKPQLVTFDVYAALRNIRRRFVLRISKVRGSVGDRVIDPTDLPTLEISDLANITAHIEVV